ncbi:MAG: hypothetical protein DA405_13580 [Bacteroidetes bacterium]|nr:MAG: hypothetical protein DA405_13580 [Bacteroidota bacterium]
MINQLKLLYYGRLDFLWNIFYFKKWLSSLRWIVSLMFRQNEGPENINHGRHITENLGLNINRIVRLVSFQVRLI